MKFRQVFFSALSQVMVSVQVLQEALVLVRILVSVLQSHAPHAPVLGVQVTFTITLSDAVPPGPEQVKV